MGHGDDTKFEKNNGKIIDLIDLFAKDNRAQRLPRKAE